MFGTFYKMKIIDITLNVFEWSLFLGLLGTSMFFTKDVIEKYFEKRTSFAVETQEVNDQPVIAICFDNFEKEFEYDNDFGIWYGIDERNALRLEENINEFPNGEIMTLEKLGFCYKISSKNYLMRKGETRKIEVVFSDELENRLDLPDQVEFFFTSSANAYGVLMGSWMDGKPFSVTNKLLDYKTISLNPQMFKYLDEKAPCTETSFYEMWGKVYQDQLQRECNISCSPISLPMANHSLCEWTWNEECPYYLSFRSFKNFLKSENYSRPCTILQYEGRVESIWKADDNFTSIVEYKFEPPEITTIYEEYFICDITSMIGSVGGTLGMCIGFSFSTLINWAMIKIRSKFVK